MNFQRPILILEGSEDIFSVRNINPNVIRAVLSSISVDFRIPIINSSSLEETAQMIRTIALRNSRSKKEIQLNSTFVSTSLNEELEKVIASIPKINIITAKVLLKHFNSISNLVNAREEEILKCEGIGKIRAKFIYNFFRNNYSMK